MPVRGKATVNSCSHDCAVAFTFFFCCGKRNPQGGCEKAQNKSILFLTKSPIHSMLSNASFPSPLTGRRHAGLAAGESSLLHHCRARMCVRPLLASFSSPCFATYMCMPCRLLLLPKATSGDYYISLRRRGNIF